ncbi:MAG: tetratricopeptide repeat protein [Blastocatellia bacterium]|nr:tetratricopeptide repeat protein [Blastocatellia bacterium]
MDIQQLMQDLEAWSLHLGFIALWGLLGAIACLLAVRCVLLTRLAARGQALQFEMPTAKTLQRMAVGFLVVAGLAAFFLQKPDRSFLLYYGARALERQKYADAVYAYETLLTSGLTRTDVYNNLAIAYFRLERYQDAVTMFGKLHEINPGVSIQSYLYCARSFEKLGRPDLAIAYVNKGLTRKWPADQEARLRQYVEGVPPTPQSAPK